MSAEGADMDVDSGSEASDPGSFHFASDDDEELAKNLDLEDAAMRDAVSEVSGASMKASPAEPQDKDAVMGSSVASSNVLLSPEQDEDEDGIMEDVVVGGGGEKEGVGGQADDPLRGGGGALGAGPPGGSLGGGGGFSTAKEINAGGVGGSSSSLLGGVVPAGGAAAASSSSRVQPPGTAHEQKGEDFLDIEDDDILGTMNVGAAGYFGKQYYIFLTSVKIFFPRSVLYQENSSSAQRSTLRSCRRGPA